MVHAVGACSADFEVCCIAGFPARWPHRKSRGADLEIGDTAGLETCATGRRIPPKTSRNQKNFVSLPAVTVSAFPPGIPMETELLEFVADRSDRGDIEVRRHWKRGRHFVCSARGDGLERTACLDHKHRQSALAPAKLSQERHCCEWLRKWSFPSSRFARGRW